MNMNSAICTLYEGNFHYGVAALTNSLYMNGFRGDIYIGIRDELPAWAVTAFSNDDLDWNEGKTFNVTNDLNLHFLKLETKYHFANYKSYFMHELLEGPAKNKDSLFYFDPDIIIKQPWIVFENWVNHNVVVVCEDVNSPLTEFHLRRLAWRRDFEKSNLKLVFKNSIYVNAGFLGVSKNHKSFLKKWIEAQEIVAELLGGVEYTPFSNVGKGFKTLSEEDLSPFSPYSTTDQDALNIAIELWNDGKVSFMGKEGMDFGPGANLMSHALGNPKPWEIKILKEAIKGRKPKQTDKDYWTNCNGPIKLHSNAEIKNKKLCIKIGKLLNILRK